MMKIPYALLRRPILASLAAGVVALAGMAGFLPGPVAFSICALFSAGSIALSLGNRRTDKVEAAERARALFLSNLNHEVRTPLNGILGMTNLILDTGLTPEQRTYALATMESGQLLSALIEDLLALSDTAGGANLEINAERSDIISLVESIGEIMAPRAWGHDFELAAVVASGVVSDPEFDSQRVRQVLMSLVSLGLHNCQSDGVLLKLSRGSEAAPDTPNLNFEIKYQGREFSSRALAQGAGTSTEPSGRTELGLMACHRIADAMGGKIRLENTADGGRAQFCLPVPDEKTNLNVKGAWPVSLVVSKSAVIRQALAIQLDALERPVFTTSTIDQAARKIHEMREAGEEIGPVLVDGAGASPETLADMLGVLKGDMDTEFRSILMLRPAERNDLDWIKDAGFDGYLMKPVRMRALRRRLETIAASLVVDDRDDETSRTPVTSFEQTASPMRILLAEDNDINATLATALMTKCGHHVVRVENGAEAVVQASDQSFDLILMDLNMPEMNGFEAAERITSAQRIDAPPIIAFSANSYETDILRCEQVGMVGHLPKPIDIDAFHKLLNDISEQVHKSHAA